MSEDDKRSFLERLTVRASEVVAENQVSKLPIRNRIALLCQVISNRYFPYTQGDRRNIRISSGNTLGGWDWFAYQNEWDAKSVLALMPFNVDVLEQFSYYVRADAEKLDPLDAWSELVRFVSLDKKNKLTGVAQLALTFRGMAYMLELFYRDIVGKASSCDKERDSIYGKGVSENDLKYLEYLTNEFHLNPRPNLILFVEGHGEYDHYLAFLMSYSDFFSELGIEMRISKVLARLWATRKRTNMVHWKSLLISITTVRQ